ncbi:TPA: ribonuclease Y [Candidatus Poribacteria bacterium]|nr:ribonuclease Y [Candidatus Poribacteria bacterium]
MWIYIVGFLGIVFGYLAHEIVSRIYTGAAKKQVQAILDEAYENAEIIKKEMIIQSKEETLQRQIELDQEVRERRAEINRLEQRIIAKEESLDSKLKALDKRHEGLIEREKKVEKRARSLKEKEAEIALLEEQRKKELSNIAQISIAEAKEMLFEQIRQEARYEATLIANEIEMEAKEVAERKAREIITYAMTRYSADHVMETAVSVVSLPSDNMKGRIIGRDGRNIRSFEAATGVELIVDDTPGAILISGFNPIRREVARLALESLIADGRINTAKIEQAVMKARANLEAIIKEEGEQAGLELGVYGLHPNEIVLLGKLKYRSSFGQNCLQHSKEVAFLSGIMAAEIGEDEKMARRAGLIHDIGKAIDSELEGSHIEIGVKLARKYNEHPEVIHAIETHHSLGEPKTSLAAIVQTADRLSSARPGVRQDSLESYVKRMEKLEELADSFDGVEKSYALQAGREVRVIVKPDRIDDVGTYRLAKEIAKKAKDELQFPGQIQVTVVRETIAVEYAK